MRILLCCMALLMADVQIAQAQGYPGGGVGGPGAGGQITGSGRGSHNDDLPVSAVEEKPDKAAAKAYKNGTKTMLKAHELEDFVAKSNNAEKKADAAQKLEDTYGKALDQFTEVLRNKNDMYDAWNQVGYIHLKFGAYRESIDDYNHTLLLKPDLTEAIQHRAEAYLGADRLDEAKAAYMDLFFHDRAKADQLMLAMQAWLQSHRAAANGMRATDIDAFDKWLQERDGIAKTAAAN